MQFFKTERNSLPLQFLLLTTALVAACSDESSQGGGPGGGSKPDGGAGPGPTSSSASSGGAGGGCSAPQPGADPCSAPLTPGTDRQCTFDYGGKSRSFLVYAPANYDPCTPVSVVVDAHGATESAEMHAGL